MPALPKGPLSFHRFQWLHPALREGRHYMVSPDYLSFECKVEDLLISDHCGWKRPNGRLLGSPPPGELRSRPGGGL